ncbi:penicillin-binding protein activator LpoB, partial [Francisella tularensis subsp. holarctica]|nr:penicillin-binding protein activator LpoB [Francisella tularensis subsp. holarctica]
ATLKMMDLKTGLVVWQYDKQIRKSQTKSTFGL